MRSMVEGAAPALADHQEHAIKVLEDGACGNSEDLDALSVQPFRAATIMPQTVGMLVRLAIHLNGQAQRGTEEVYDVRSDRVLPTEPEPAEPAAPERGPQNHLRQGQPAAKIAGAADGKLRSLHRDNLSAIHAIVSPLHRPAGGPPPPVGGGMLKASSAS